MVPPVAQLAPHQALDYTRGQGLPLCPLGTGTSWDPISLRSQDGTSPRGRGEDPRSQPCILALSPARSCPNSCLGVSRPPASCRSHTGPHCPWDSWGSVLRAADPLSGTPRPSSRSVRATPAGSLPSPALGSAPPLWPLEPSTHFTCPHGDSLHGDTRAARSLRTWA